METEVGTGRRRLERKYCKMTSSEAKMVTLPHVYPTDIHCIAQLHIVHVHIHVHVCVYTCTCMCIYMYMYVYIHVHVCVYTCTCIYIQCICTCILCVLSKSSLYVHAFVLRVRVCRFIHVHVHLGNWLRGFTFTCGLMCFFSGACFFKSVLSLRCSPWQ